MKILLPNKTKSKFGKPKAKSCSIGSQIRTVILSLCLVFLGFSLNGCAFSDALARYVNPPDFQSPTSTPIVILKTTPLPPTPTSVPCQQTQGSVSRVSFESAELGEEFTFSIYTPPCYDPALPAGYPVVYLLHGQSQDDLFWFDLGAAGIADTAIQSGRKPFVMVMPYEVDNYAPVPDSNFGAAVVEELIPYVEANYAVCKTRDCRAIGGISHGAGWAVHIAAMNIDLFGSVGAHSVGFFAGDSYRIDRLRKTMSPGEFPRFYIDRGEKDYLASEIDALDRTLTRNGIPHEFIVQPGSHSASYWKAHIQEYLLWYMDGWDPPA
jgi:enterochelin esterase-like enzyme